MCQTSHRPLYSTVEPLEQRIAPAAFVVTNLADDGAGSLRRAILDANSHAGADTITFSLSGTIKVLSALPVITETLSINALVTGSGIRIELDGSSAGPDTDGLKFISANASQSLIVRGLAITRFDGDGIEITGGGAHVLANDYFGVSVFSPKSPAGNGGNGVLITDAVTFAIGDAGMNVISGNGLAGIAIRGLVGNVTTGASATINNNYIGTNSVGLIDVGNGEDGVSISVKVGSNIFVGTGGNGSAARNLISGNGGYGVHVTDDGSVATSSLRAMICVFGNFIGTDSSGGKSLGNDLGGIFYSGLVGGKLGTWPSSGNVISGNHGPGITISGVPEPPPIKDYKTYEVSIRANKIGTNKDGSVALSNAGAGVIVDGSIGVSIGAASYTDTQHDLERNIISGNVGVGVLLRGGRNNTIGANIIGLNASGQLDLGNTSHGIEIDRSGGFIIDGSLASFPISGNGGDGIFIHDTTNGSRSVPPGPALIGRVFVGTSATGNRAIGNDGSGVRILNTLGMTFESSVISGNYGNGITVSASSYVSVGGVKIGTDASGNMAVPNGGDGLQLIGSSNNKIGTSLTIISGNRGAGISLLGGISDHDQSIPSSQNIIQRTYIGVGADGAKAIPNGSHGVLLSGHVLDNTIGGQIVRSATGGISSLTGNVISANTGDGIHIETSYWRQNPITGNLIGTDRTGLLARGNENGIGIADSTGERIGGVTPGSGNVISANRQDGISIRFSAPGNVVLGNFIGTDATGNAPLGNGGDGVSDWSGANLIGVDTTGVAGGNRIAGNGHAGMRLIGGGNRVSYNTVTFNSSDGVVLLGSHNIVGGNSVDEGNLIAGNGGHGVFFDGRKDVNHWVGNVIAGNTIGFPLATDFGVHDTFGNLGDGIRIEADHIRDTIIGIGLGENPAIIGSGNRIANSGGHGIAIVGGSADPIGGTQIAGNTVAENGAGGILVSHANDTNIGGTENNFGNVISGNRGPGLEILDSEAGTVVGNTIGKELAPNVGSGIRVDGVTNFQIGGTEAGARNELSGNRGAGITITGSSVTNEIRGNLISHNSGAGVSVLAGTGQTILANSIFANTGLGIDLGDDGPTANDRDDTDAGPNHFQNFVILRSVVTHGGKTHVRGAIESTPNTSFHVEFFANDNAASAGQTFLESVEVLTDAHGRAQIKLDNTSLPLAQFITATVTDLSTNVGDTSEFSSPLGNIAAPPLIAITAANSQLPEVQVIDAMNGVIRFTVLAYEPDFLRGAHIATGDFDHDGIDDVAVGPGPGHRPEIKIFSGFDGVLISSFVASGSLFKHGVFVTAEDLDGDGYPEVVATENRASVPSNAMDGMRGIQVPAFTKTLQPVSVPTLSSPDVPKLLDDGPGLLSMSNLNRISKIIDAGKLCASR